MSCTEVMFPVFPTDGLYRQWKDPLGRRKAGLPQMQDSLDAENYSSTSGAVIKEEEVLEKDLVPKDTQYLTANCVLFTYFSGDISSVVDEHFSRALSQASACSGAISAPRSSAWKDGWPMSQRNFPPSFWNSAYQPPSASMSSATIAADPYISGPFHGFTGFHPQDPWHYPSTSQARSHGFSHHRSMTAMPSVHDFGYGSMTSPSHYGPHYGSILMQQTLRPGRLPHALSHQYDLGMLGKTPESWGSRLNATGRLGGDFTAPSSLDPSVSGLDSGLQDTTKEPYWF